MPTHTETRFLPYTPQQMFALVADVAKYPEFLPWCTHARIIKQQEDMLLAELGIGYKLIRESFVSRVHLDRNALTVQVGYVSGPLRYLRNEWRFLPAEKGGCQIDFFVHFEFSSRILSHLMDMFFDVAFRQMVSAFEKRAQEIYD